MKIGITGGIGSGKSYVCHLLQEQGFAIYDCDNAAKRLIKTSQEIRKQLTDLIGPDTYFDDGRLNKGAVAEFLLASEENAHAVDHIVHPAVFDDFIKSGMEWMESAIIFDSGIYRLVDRVIVVTAPKEVRIQRVMQRDGISREKVKEWMSRQLPQEVVRLLADYEIVNDGQTDLNKQLNIILEKCNKLF